MRLLLVSAALMAFLTPAHIRPYALPALSATHRATSPPAKTYPPIRGIAFHFCSCSLPCPCLFTGHDVEGCNVVTVYHYTTGGYIGKQIVNRTVVVVPYPKEFKAGKEVLKANGQPLDSVLYLPPGLTPKQEQELLAPILEMDMQFPFQNAIRRHADILFRATSKGYEVSIPGVFHVVTEKLIGANGKQITAENIPAKEGTRWFFGKTKRHTYQDKEQPAWKWSLPGKMGSWTFFTVGPHKEM